MDIVFRLPLVGDCIEYVDKNDKSAGYELVDGDTTTTTTVSHELVKSMGVDARRLGRKEEVAKKLKELGVEDSLINLKGITQGMLVILGQRNIKKLSDFADLSSDELIGGFDEIKGKKIRIEGYLEEFSLSREEADQLIMSAREIVYK